MSNEDKDTNKYAVRTSLYNTLKFGNTSLKNTEVGLNKMLEYFSDYYTKEQLLDNIANYNLDTMFNDVKSYFYSEYNFDATNVELVNLYQRYITSFVCHNKENSEDSIILHIDELLESTMLSFFIAMFKWSNDFNDLEVYGECFKYVLYLLNDVCIFGEMQGEDANRMLLSLMKNDIHILNIAESCYWTVIAFNIAHEIAHAYLESIGKSDDKYPKKEEFLADSIGYDIVLKMIMNSNNKKILDEYTYLAPMMFMDFIDLFYYTDRVLYKTYINNFSHPPVKKRKSNLFAIVNDDKYDFNTEEGNALYNAFLNVYDEYRTQLLLKKEKGKLERICRTDKRNKMKGDKE